MGDCGAIVVVVVVLPVAVVAGVALRNTPVTCVRTIADCVFGNEAILNSAA
jgi:hypothetical protein